MVLACDVGGTKTRLSLFDRAGDGLTLVRTEKYASREHDSLTAIVANFIGAETQPLTAAGFGVAGPVVNGRTRTTNLPWVVDAAELASQLSLPSVALLNDVETLAWSVEQLAPSDLLSLQQGESTPSGNLAIIAAGTGLGLSALVRSESGTASVPSEGGHAEFAPRTDREVELWRGLHARFGHVSSERVLSGPGLHNIYEFVRDTHGGAEPGWLTEEMRAGDPSAAIANAGFDGRSPACTEALELFVGIYGAESGNWMLRTMAKGGVYLGGGIAPKLFARGTRGAIDLREVFLLGFADKGRLRPLLESVPVHVILNDEAALLGSAHFALRTARA
jgi:glucokinase